MYLSNLKAQQHYDRTWSVSGRDKNDQLFVRFVFYKTKKAALDSAWEAINRDSEWKLIDGSLAH